MTSNAAEKDDARKQWPWSIAGDIVDMRINSNREDSTKPLLLQLDPTLIKEVHINIGSNDDPIDPPSVDGSVFVLAVEPLIDTVMRIPPHPRRAVLACAVGGGDVAVQMFQALNTKGESSSLAPLDDGAAHLVERQGRVPRFAPVPVLPLSTILNAIHPSIRISFLKTDMQGFDTAALTSAGDALRRVERIQAEVYTKGFTYHPSQKNDLDRDLMPFMEAHGFRLEDVLREGRPDPTEADAIFVNQNKQR